MMSKKIQVSCQNLYVPPNARPTYIKTQILWNYFVT